jgi:hypothetical protein
MFLGNISTMKDFVYEIYHSTSPNLKLKCTIKTLNPKFPAEIIHNMTFVDSKNESNYKTFEGSSIQFGGIDSAYIEVPQYLIAKEVYLKSIGLQNGIIYQVTKKIYEFNIMKSVTPSYLYSYEGTDIVEFTMSPYKDYVYLTYNDLEYKFNCRNNKCKTTVIEYGKDYFINYYDNVVLHTIIYNFNNKCLSSNDKQTDIYFYLFSESVIPNIKSLSIKLFEKKKKKEISNSISYLKFEKIVKIYKYTYKVNSSSLVRGDYYVEFNGTSFYDYELVIAVGKNMQITKRSYLKKSLKIEVFSDVFPKE